MFANQQFHALSGATQGGSEVPALASELRGFQRAKGQHDRCREAVNVTLRAERHLHIVGEPHVLRALDSRTGRRSYMPLQRSPVVITLAGGSYMPHQSVTMATPAKCDEWP